MIRQGFNRYGTLHVSFGFRRQFCVNLFFLMKNTQRTYMYHMFLSIFSFFGVFDVSFMFVLMQAVSTIT